MLVVFTKFKLGKTSKCGKATHAWNKGQWTCKFSAVLANYTLSLRCFTTFYRVHFSKEHFISLTNIHHQPKLQLQPGWVLKFCFIVIVPLICCWSLSLCGWSSIFIFKLKQFQVILNTEDNNHERQLLYKDGLTRIILLGKVLIKGAFKSD